MHSESSYFKEAEEVHAVLPIFFTFGAPVILQSDNSRMFVNSVIRVPEFDRGPSDPRYRLVMI